MSILPADSTTVEKTFCREHSAILQVQRKGHTKVDDRNSGGHRSTGTKKGKQVGMPGAVEPFADHELGSICSGSPDNRLAQDLQLERPTNWRRGGESWRKQEFNETIQRRLQGASDLETVDAETRSRDRASET